MLANWYQGTYPMKSAKSYRRTHDWVSNGEERAECRTCWCKDGGEASRWPCGAKVPRVIRCAPPKAGA